MVSFATLAALSRKLAAIRSRNEKIAALAELLRTLAPGDVATSVGFLVAEPRMGTVGLGPSHLWSLDDVPACDASSLTAREVEDTLATLRGRRDTEMMSGARALFAKLTNEERIFLIGSLTESLRQGGLVGLMMRAIAYASEHDEEEVRRAARVMGGAAAVADALLGSGKGGPLATGITLFRPVSPMLASSNDSVAEALTATRRAHVEWKVDGVRAQVHKDGSRVELFSRQGKPLGAGAAVLLPRLTELAAENLVLDAEVVLLDETDRALSFQDSFSFIASARIEARDSRRLAIFAFDCLRRNGVDLLDMPLRERLTHLRAVVPAPLVMPALEEPDEEDALAFWDEAMDQGHEGVMVKDLDAPYAAGLRSTTWIKVKHVSTVDLVVLAVEWGSGRRKGLLSNLHLGALREDGTFCMIGKTFKGLTDAMLREQTEALIALEERRTDHVVHVRPEFVVEVSFNDVQRSSRYPGGIALRFARVKRFRPDKTASDIEPLANLVTMAPAAVQPKKYKTSSKPKAASQTKAEKKERAKPSNQLSLFDDGSQKGG